MPVILIGRFSGLFQRRRAILSTIVENQLWTDTDAAEYVMDYSGAQKTLPNSPNSVIGSYFREMSACRSPMTEGSYRLFMPRRNLHITSLPPACLTTPKGQRCLIIDIFVSIRFIKLSPYHR